MKFYALCWFPYSYYICYIKTIVNRLTLQKLEQNEKRTKAITDYKKGHKKVIEGLEAYPLSLSENCMVPIGKLAFMKGKLTHTNEILVYLGEGYFVKYSASQAIALCNRRIACINIIYYIYPYIYIIYILILYIIYILEEKHFIRYYDCYMFLCYQGRMKCWRV